MDSCNFTEPGLYIGSVSLLGKSGRFSSIRGYKHFTVDQNWSIHSSYNSHYYLPQGKGVYKTHNKTQEETMKKNTLWLSQVNTLILNRINAGIVLILIQKRKTNRTKILLRLRQDHNLSIVFIDKRGNYAFCNRLVTLMLVQNISHVLLSRKFDPEAECQ